LRYRLGVSTRRFLSDLRDNHLARSKRMLRAVEAFRKTLGRPKAR
jgi:hypothetical protein